jgi:hypothetical protein
MLIDSLAPPPSASGSSTPPSHASPQSATAPTADSHLDHSVLHHPSAHARPTTRSVDERRTSLADVVNRLRRRRRRVRSPDGADSDSSSGPESVPRLSGRQRDSDSDPNSDGLPRLPGRPYPGVESDDNDQTASPRGLRALSRNGRRVPTATTGPPTGQQVLNERRNAARTRDRDERDSEHLSKYLPCSPEFVFSDIVEGPDDAFIPPSWLIEAIQEVATSPSPTPKMPPVRFATDEGSLDHNADILGRYDFDLSELLDHLADTTLGYGSELRPISQLQKIFRYHTNFPFFRSVIRSGMPYFFSSEISDDVRRTELENQLTRGNHKSATANPEIAEKALRTDVRYGFAIPLPAETVLKIPGRWFSPADSPASFPLKLTGPVNSSTG